MITENNTARIRLELIDRPIRVLYVEGYPRWEYRYLKNMLMREKSILSSILLLSADRGFAQEGDVPITRLPGDAEEIEPFDVIIVGDVPSSFFSAAQLSLIRDHVGARGAGLLWVGGDDLNGVEEWKKQKGGTQMVLRDNERGPPVGGGVHDNAGAGTPAQQLNDNN